jgi:hypothetical protein
MRLRRDLQRIIPRQGRLEPELGAEIAGEPERTAAVPAVTRPRRSDRLASPRQLQRFRPPAVGTPLDHFARNLHQMAESWPLVPRNQAETRGLANGSSRVMAGHRVSGCETGCRIDGK